MFLLLLTWFAAAQFNNEEIKNVVANALSDAASKKSRKIDEFEKEMLPGTYVIGQWIIELAHPLTGPTAREIQGYSTSPNYYTIVVDKSKVYDSSTVITDPKEQKYYILEEEVHKVELDTDLQHRKEVRVFNKKEIDKMKVFTRVQMRSHFDVKANERGDLCSIDSSGAECAKDFSYNWDEKTDKPQLKEVMGIKVGVGAISSFSFDVDLDLFWIGFFCQVKLGANIKAGAAIEIPKVIEIGSIALFEKSFNLLNGLTSISLFGTSVGLTLNISLTGSIEDIKITLGKEFNYFKGYEVTASKVYTISSESGFQQSDWITTAGSIGDDFNLAESIKDLLSEIMLHAKPTLSFGITLAVEWGDPIVSVQVSFDFSVPISFGINSKLCSMPYLAGSIGFSFDIVLTIPEITLMDITIFDEFKESIHVFDIDSGQMCLFDPKLNIEEKDDDYITKVFKNDNLVYLEIDADQHVTYNFIVEISTDQVNIKRDLIYVELQKGESRQLSPITIDKANDPSVKVYTQEWENDDIKTTLIFSKHLGVMNDKEDLTEKVTNCKLTLIKIACKDVDFGKYISRDTSVGALTFKVPVTKGVYQYLPISFNDKVTACGIPYYPIYSSLTTVQENNAGLIESQPGHIFKLKITAINIKKSLLQLQLTRFTSGNDGNPFFSVNLKDKSPGKQNLQDLGINPEAEYFHVSGKLEALFQSDKYTLQESPSLDLSKEQSGTHEFQTEYGSITISYEPVSEYDITFLYSQPQSMMIARYLNGYYMPPSYDNDFGWTYSENIPIDSPNNQEQLNPNVKYVVLGIGIDAESAMPDNFNGYIVLHVPGWTVLSKDSHEIKDGIFVVYINPSVGNHINT
ncbi:hypothetical protein TRFO_31793 [Tritrichomonas foetus]|uniref:Uncharacterized protein n=1 Tax=Tritrichomonas foetus TaxID=1144522 RepID=A0A1J4JV65_9EUKA|nr:hypothetical protein TRFO_31793 [Tritrichomonas foetus]|eukprot:OHT01412.1 hypothetical protein TRFO_31793 [Tritrichomonas foetus]